MLAWMTPMTVQGQPRSLGSRAPQAPSTHLPQPPGPQVHGSPTFFIVPTAPEHPGRLRWALGLEQEVPPRVNELKMVAWTAVPGLTGAGLARTGKWVGPGRWEGWGCGRVVGGAEQAGRNKAGRWAEPELLRWAGPDLSEGGDRSGVPAGGRARIRPGAGMGAGRWVGLGGALPRTFQEEGLGGALGGASEPSQEVGAGPRTRTGQGTGLGPGCRRGRSPTGGVPGRFLLSSRDPRCPASAGLVAGGWPTAKPWLCPGHLHPIFGKLSDFVTFAFVPTWNGADGFTVLEKGASQARGCLGNPRTLPSCLRA